MTYAPPHRALDRVFKISIVLKGLDGVFELVGGIALLFVDPQWVRTWWSGWTAHLMVGHEHSPIWHGFEHLAGVATTPQERGNRRFRRGGMKVIHRPVHSLGRITRLLFTG